MSVPGHGLYDGQVHEEEAERLMGGASDDAAVQAQAILAVHAELRAIRVLAEDTIQRVMGSRPGVQVAKTVAGVRITENLTAADLARRSPASEVAARQAARNRPDWC